MRRSKDSEINAMTRGLALLSPLTSAQRRRVLSWLASRIPDMDEPESKVLPGQLPMFGERPNNAEEIVARAAANTERAFPSKQET